MNAAATTRAFRRFAGEEAARYGSDAWVWVRELLQNARDASATRIDFLVEARHEKGPGGESRREEEEPGDRDGIPGVRFRIRDDGSGMTLDHARTYLLALYASSKEDSALKAGRFGVGFWSVLRLHPERILIRSRPRGGADRGETGWEIEVEGDLEQARSSECELEAPGTEIVLEQGDLGVEEARNALNDAVDRYGRYLMQADAANLPLEIRVDGILRNRSFELPAPSASFRGAGFRGIVALSDRPEVELFSHGLLVRSTPVLRDLIEDAARRGEQIETSGLEDIPASAPRFLLDSGRLDLMLARSDARQDRELRRLVRRAEGELRLLVDRQLQAIRPQPWWRLAAVKAREMLRRIEARHLRRAGAVAAAVGCGALLALWLPRDIFPRDLFPRPSAPRSEPAGSDKTSDEAVSGARSGAVESPGGSGVPLTGRSTAAGSGPALELPAGIPGAPRPYRDLAGRYLGPSPASEAVLGTVQLSYHPPDRGHFFAALRLDESAGSDRSEFHWSPGEPLGRPYRGVPCRRDCLDVELRVAQTAEPLRLPLPTGHGLDPGSVLLGGRRVAATTTTLEEAILAPGRPLPEGTVVRYRTGPVRGPAPAVPDGLRVPPGLEGIVAELAPLSPALRLARAVQWVESAILYQPAPRFLAARDPADWLRTALVEGAGDCDVQNAALATILRRVGQPARLAIGFVGAGGRVVPGLHAWAEVHDGAENTWEIADASTPVALDAGLRSPGAEGLRETAPGSSRGARGTPGRDASDVATGDPDPRLAPAFDPEAGATAGRRFGLGAAILGLVLALGGRWWVRSRRARHRRTHLGREGQLPALLAGALRHPESFADLPALRFGRFVPTLDGDAISLDRALRRAREGRLLAARRHRGLATEAARRAPVLDLGTEEGRIVAGGLGAVDLDDWEECLAASHRTAETRRLDALLEGSGVMFRETPTLASPRLLDLARHGLGARQVVLDPRVLDPLRATEDRASGDGGGAALEEGGFPEATAFTLLDRILHGLGLEPGERDRVLALAARRLLEAP